jgi:hypothetical protein
VRGALEMRSKLLGPRHADAAGSMTLLAGLLIETGRYEEARALASGAKAILREALGPDHWRTASAEAAEGAALAGLRQFEKAEPLLLAANGVLAKDTQAVHIYVTSSNRWLATLYEATGNRDKAAPYVVKPHLPARAKP